MGLIQAVYGLLEELAPSRCVGCDIVLCEDDGKGFCHACLPLLEPVAALAFKPPGPNASLYVYGGPLADGICRFKYQARSDLGCQLAALMTVHASAYYGQLDAVLAVPLHPRRLHQRGFNQSALLARTMAKALALPFNCTLLQRVRDTPPQAELERSRRLSNMQGAFAVMRSCRGQRLLVIDDVRTTGATLAMVSEALMLAGAQKVVTLTLARAEI